MSAAIAFVIGAAVSAIVWRSMSAQFGESEVLRRSNYRGHALPVASGVVLVLAVVLIAAVASVPIVLGGTTLADARRLSGLVGFVGGTLGFGFIGLLDDLVGATSTKGFGGHLRALATGRITTGFVKLLWGVLIGILVSPGSGWAGIRGGVLIAACANLGNLFDRAPGRTVKVSLLGGVVALVVGGPAWQMSGMTVVLGAGAGLLFPDLRERCMLGDTGSNVLGGAVGFGLVVAAGPTGEWVALAIVVALNLASEFVSFSKVIDATPPLRWFDRLGARAERG
jgi:UDP-GlcNAc:undecaprenyl-phosphate/decaprenyl-phosphate GlcNAc-1-phosphate transferase